MAIKKLTFDLAVGALDGYIQKKATHATKDILTAMQSLSGASFVTVEDQQDFSNICANFDKHVNSTGKTSIGRKQFEAWWEINDTIEEVGEVLQHPDTGQLPDSTVDIEQVGNMHVTEDVEGQYQAKFTDLALANAYINALEAESAHIRAENEVFRMQLTQIEAVIRY